MYGYQNSDELAPGKSGGKFGLNTGAFVTKFEYNPNAGANGAEADAIDFTVQIGEREYMQRFFPPVKAYAGGNEITDTSSDKYKEQHAKDIALFNATLCDIVVCFVPEADLKQALAAPIANFKDYAQILQRLVQSVPNWNKQPVDVFLQYQYNIKGDNDRTFLELPRNSKHGTYVVKSLGTGFKEDRTDTHIKYVNAEGITHPFKRNQWYTTSAFAKPTTLDDATTSSSAAMTGSSAEANW